MTDGSQDWQACLEWIWNYGNSRHIAKAQYEGEPLSSLQGSSMHSLPCTDEETASHPQTKNKNKSRSKQHRPQKPLLHQVLRTVGFKAQQGPKLKENALRNIPEEKQNVTMELYDAITMRRGVLQLSDPNGRVGKSGQAPKLAAEPGAKAIR